MGEKDQVPYEDDDVDSYDDYDDDIDIEDEDDEEPVSSAAKDRPYTQARINARHAIERRAELKALRDALDEWDEFDEDEL